MSTGDSRDNAQRHHFTFDTELQLKDAGLVAASGAATVGGSAKVLDLGDGFVQGQVWFNITAIESGSADETYEIMLQFSDGSDFSSDNVFAQSFHVGTGSNGWTDQYITGIKVMPFNNRYINSSGDEENFRYMRVYTVVGGTISTGINFEAWVVKLD